MCDFEQQQQQQQREVELLFALWCSVAEEAAVCQGRSSFQECNLVGREVAGKEGRGL